jgi:CheY-like chemotaxis protein
LYKKVWGKKIDAVMSFFKVWLTLKTRNNKINVLGTFNSTFVEEDKMNTKAIIEGKSLLLVDDEKDILETLVDLLYLCKIDTASSFEEAKKMLDKNDYDLVVLDIMGVRGYELLEISKEKKIPALMLTAHALSSDNLRRSAEKGAAYYAPKDEIENIQEFIADILDAIRKKKSTWERMFDRLGSFYDKKFNGPDWREKEKKFWEEKLHPHSI